MNIQNSQSPEKKPFTLSQPWEKYLPSKRIRVILIILVLLAILYGLKNPITHLFQKLLIKSTDVVVTIPNPQAGASKTILSTDKDTDGDGLADWQETLIGTDPLVPNSKEEVPQEFRDVVNSATNGVIGTEDKLALRVYQRLLTDPKGTNIEEAVQAATTKEILDLAESVDNQQRTYSIDDLNLVDDTPEERATYKQSLQKILIKINPSDSMLGNIYDGILKGGVLQVDIVYRTLLAGSIKNLLEMPVPFKLADHHLTLLNAITHAYGIAETASTTAVEKSDESMRFVSFLAFQKNLNLSNDTIFVIFKVLSY